MKCITATWVALILLTGLTMVARAAAPPELANGIILSLAGLKAAVVAIIFMEGRRAHPWWRILVLGLLAVVLGAITLIGSRAPAETPVGETRGARPLAGAGTQASPKTSADTPNL